MKNIFLIYLFIFSSSIISQWQTFTLSTNSDFNDVCVVSPDIIWAAGYSSTVFRTTNAGFGWQSVNNGLQDLAIYQISAVDENRAWIISNNRIFATTNGGSLWTEQFFSPISFINKIHFFNQNTGYILCDPVDSIANFFITRNGGINWVKSVNSPVIRISTVMYIQENGVNSIDTNFVWFVTKGASSIYSRFYKLNGGLEGVWQNYIIGNTPQQCDFAAFTDTNNGVLKSNTQGILSTTNGGVNWTQRNSSIFQSVTSDLINIPGADWILQTGVNNIRLSKDMCLNWHFNSLFNFNSRCDSKDTNSIWIAASEGRLLKYNFNYIGIQMVSTNIPVSFVLHQNYPNPFNPETNIKFELPEAGLVTFKIYDVNGREVYNISENHSAGVYNLNYNAEKLSSGVYYYSAEFNGKREVKKMIVLK